MSLLDTFCDVASGSGSPSIARAGPGPSLLDTVSGDATGNRDDLVDGDRVATTVLEHASVHRCDVAAPEFRQGDVAVVPRRGRPKGTCGWQQDLKKMKSDFERPQRHEVPSSLPSPAIPPKPPEVPTAQLSLVPFLQPHDAIVPSHLRNKKSEEAISVVDAMTMQKMKEANPYIESQLVGNVQSFASSLVLSKKTLLHPKTIKKKLRLLALIVIVFKRVMTQLAILGVDQAMSRQVGRDRVQPLYFATKYKYDEMSMKVSNKSDAKESLSAVTTKLLQLSVEYLCLWKVGNKYVKMITHMPTSLLSIERNNAQCLTEALSRQVQTPPVAHTLFKDRAAVAVADDHAANGLCDSALSALGVTDVESKWKCRTHKVQKIADICVQRYKNEKRGLLHTCLSFAFAGQWKEFQANMKIVLKARLRCMPFGSEGAGQAAQTHREAVFKQFCDISKWDMLGEHSKLSAKLMTENHVRRKLHNGDFRKKKKASSSIGVQGRGVAQAPKTRMHNCAQSGSTSSLHQSLGKMTIGDVSSPQWMRSATFSAATTSSRQLSC